MDQLWSLLRISSSQLPIGGYSYSQGLESAIDSQKINTIDEAKSWLFDQLFLNLTRFEGPLLFHLCLAIHHHKWPQAKDLSDRLYASRETLELCSESRQMGYSLMELLNTMGNDKEEIKNFLQKQTTVHFPLAWAITAYYWDITPENTIKSWLWTWLENQSSVLIKTLPLGQLSAQKMINYFLPYLEQAQHMIISTDLSQVGTLAFGFTLNSMQHEHQYSRLFRS